MSDYLANLAARTLATPPLRPRVRMRFEPEAAEGTPQPQRFEPEAVAAPPPQPVMPRIETRHRVERVETPPRVIERESEREQRRERESPPRVITRQTTVAAPASEPEVTERVEQVERIETRVIQPSERHAIEEEREAGTREDLHPSPPKEAEAPQRPHRYDLEPPRVAAPASPRVREPERIRREPTRTAPPSGIAQKSEPDIQITIGRIEVRATSAPAAPRRGRARAVMTIDDYIAKRDGKERR